MNTVKTCRYGHGELVKSPDTWTLPLMRITPPNAIGQDGSLIDTNSVWTCSVLVCKTCGYIELEDKDVHNGNAS